MEWFGYTVGVVAHLWAAMTFLALIIYASDPLIKAGLKEIKLSNTFFVPWIGIIGFWMWVIYG
jgi:hypothetical protein